MNPDIPIYQKIAVDIAQRIVTGEFSIGAKISGRSMLSGNYKVSPETIRKAIAMLRTAAVVAVSQGKEPLVVSSLNAYAFIEENKNMESLYSLKERFVDLLWQRAQLEQELEYLFDQVFEHSNRFKDITPYNPIEIELTEESFMVNKSVSDTHFWQHTKATVVAIRRKGKVIISPGPHEKMKARDRLVIVGTIESINKAVAFINNGATT